VAGSGAADLVEQGLAALPGAGTGHHLVEAERRSRLAGAFDLGQRRGVEALDGLGRGVRRGARKLQQRRRDDCREAQVSSGHGTLPVLQAFVEAYHQIHLFKDALAGGAHIGGRLDPIGGGPHLQRVLEEEPLLLDQRQLGLDLGGALGAALRSSWALANSFMAASSMLPASAVLTPIWRNR
jgi:hypothetical protein